METNLNKWIVYCTTNLINNKIYIGVHKTENYEIFDGYIGCNVRVNHPSSYMNPQTPFQFAVKKYGPKNFKRTIIKANLTKEEAFKLEGEIVDINFVKRRDTYNASIGGNGGKPGKPIYQFDFSGTLLKKWESIVEVCEFYNISWSSVYNAAFYKTSRNNYYWSFYNKINPEEFVNAAGIKIYAYNAETGDLIENYESISEASRILNIKKDLIQRAVNTGYKTHNLYFSKKLLPSYTGVELLEIRNKPIYIYNLSGDFEQELKNTKEILSFFNIKATGSVRAAIRANKPYKGHLISLSKEEKLQAQKDPRNFKKKVGMYNLVGDLIKTYETVTQARNEYGAGVSRCLRGQQKTCHNSIFKYIS